MAMYEKLLTEKSRDTMRVRFHNPALHNAMDGQMLTELVQLCRELDLHGGRQVVHGRC